MKRSAIFALALALSPALFAQDAQQRPQRGTGDGFRPPPSPLMEALDANKDGTISSEEMGNATAALKKADKNGDGQLSPDELRVTFGRPGGDGQRPPGTPGTPGTPDGQRPGGGDLVARLMAMDKNSDGKVTKEEAGPEGQRYFERGDSNQDGAIDKKEAEAMAERFRQSFGNRRPGDGDKNGRPDQKKADEKK